MTLLDRIQQSPVVKRLLKLIPQASVQEKVDLYRAALLLKCREVCLRTESGSPSESDVEVFTRSVETMGKEAMYRFVQDSMSKQMVTMFESLEKVDEMRNHAGLNARESALREKQNTILMGDLSYIVERRESSVSGAGNGVFIDAASSVPPGTLLLLYPGLVHIKQDLKDPAYFQALLPDPEFMIMTRLDQILIDGRTADKVPYNPYALGHLVNHCGKDRQPNVMQVAFDFPSGLAADGGFPADLRRFIPNSFAKPPSLMNKMILGPFTLMPSVAFLSTRHVQPGDELLMDYRLHPDSKTLPNWYQPYDAEEARNRWA